MQIKLFVKKDCPRCPAAKHAVSELPDVEVYDVGEVDGLAEAAFCGVLATPTVLVLDENGTEIAAWRGEAPDRARLHELVAG